MPKKQTYFAFIATIQIALVALVALVTLAACGGTTPEPLPRVQTGPLNVRVSRDVYPAHASPNVAVNPRNPQNLIGTAVLLQPNPAYPRSSNINTINHVGTFASMDGGMSWRDNGPLPMPSGFAESFYESLAFNAQGTGFIAAVVSATVAQNAVTRIVLWHTSDRGASFSSSQKITSTAWNPSNGINGWAGDHEGLALGPTKIYPIWNDTRAGHLEIYTATLPL